MAKKKKKIISVRLVVVSVLFIILFAATVGLLIKLITSENNKLFTSPTSQVIATPTPIHVASPEEVILELSLLEEYLRDNNLAFPGDYQTLTSAQGKIAVLVSEIFDREISWWSGGFIFVSFLGSPQDIENVDKLKNKAKEKIENYYSRAQEGELISVLVNEANSDSEIVEFNKYLAFRQDRLFDDLYKNKLFEQVAIDDGLISSSEEFDEAVFANEKGHLTDIFEDQFGFIFGAVTDSKNGNYDTYSEWIKDVSEGQLSRSVFRFTKISR